jgi:hypothetical protein
VSRSELLEALLKARVGHGGGRSRLPLSWAIAPSAFQAIDPPCGCHRLPEFGYFVTLGDIGADSNAEDETRTEGLMPLVFQRLWGWWVGWDSNPRPTA